MKTIYEIRQENLKKTEEHLASIGLIKCELCNYWNSKENIIKDNKCYKHFSEENIKWI